MTKTGSAVYVPWWAGHVWGKDHLCRRTTFICLTFGGLLTVDSTESTNKALVISSRKTLSVLFHGLLCRCPFCVVACCASVDFCQMLYSAGVSCQWSAECPLLVQWVSARTHYQHPGFVDARQHEVHLSNKSVPYSSRPPPTPCPAPFPDHPFPPMHPPLFNIWYYLAFQSHLFKLSYCLCVCVVCGVCVCAHRSLFWLCFSFLLCNGLCSSLEKQHTKEYIISI